MELIDNLAYQASARIAAEKGSYPLFDVDAVLEEGTHASTLWPETQDLIREHGLRNALLTSIAPTGTISLYAGNVSSGIEPIFAPSYTRKVIQKGGTKTEQVVMDYAVAKYHEWRKSRNVQDQTLPDYFVSAQTLSPLAHLSMQAAAQRHVDSSISKTINLPKDISFTDFKEVYLLAYDMGCKGCTTYRPNDITGSVLAVNDETGQGPTLDDAAQISDLMAAATATGASLDMTRPDRPKTLFGATYHIKVGEQSAVYLTVNDIEEPDGTTRPFEMFLRCSDTTHDEWMVALSRLVSSIMRRPFGCRFVADEFMRIQSPHTGGFAGPELGYQSSILAAIGTILKRHMDEQDRRNASGGPVNLEMATPFMEIVAPTGEKCPQCHEHAMKVESGCKSCTSCGWSKCG
jgi:ribonucleoside-diphosphate reductase alpha chain